MNVVRVLADILFSQMGFAYDFEFLHAFLSNKINKIQPNKMGGTPLHPPNCHFRVDISRSVCAWVSKDPSRRTHIISSLLCLNYNTDFKNRTIQYCISLTQILYHEFIEDT